MKVETIEIGGFVTAFKALRLPFKGTDKSDSAFGAKYRPITSSGSPTKNTLIGEWSIRFGEKDLSVFQRLIKNGDEHAKAVRAIKVSCEITAPRYFWQEMDTYRIGSEGFSSESTIHTILKDDIGYDSFEQPNIEKQKDKDWFDNVMDMTIVQISNTKNDYTISNQEKLEVIKALLPESYLQTRIRDFTYQTLRRIYFQRKDHKLPQWKIFIDWIKTLPLANELILIEG